MKKTTTRLADGRELVYYDSRDDIVREAVDLRPLDATTTSSEIRHDPLLDEWVVVASHRQGRTHHPPADECPLCPSRGGRHSEIPADDYDVVVFENRFPSLTGGPGDRQTVEQGPFARRAGAGRCEVVCFTSDHNASFADLTPERAALVLDVWTDRTAELSEMPGVQQVFCFENRGKEIGVTLGHPHGQIYAYPFTTPRTARMIASVAAHRERTGRNLFDDRLDAERKDGARVVAEGEHWTAFVPYGAHWPYEVHLYPHRRVPDLRSLDGAARSEFPHVYLDLLRRFDRLFTAEPGTMDPEPVRETPKGVAETQRRVEVATEGRGSGIRPKKRRSEARATNEPTPYIAAWHQSPLRPDVQADFALHLELFTIRRTSGKLKFLAGSESGMNVFINDVPPEVAARRLREVATL